MRCPRAYARRFKTCDVPRAPDVLTQCRWEQYYVRNSMTRSLIYNYVRAHMPFSEAVTPRLHPSELSGVLHALPRMRRPTCACGVHTVACIC